MIGDSCVIGCNGGWECVSAVNDGRCSPWVMCSCSVVSATRFVTEPPLPKGGFQTPHTKHNPGGRWSGGGTGGGNGGPGPCGANETGAHQRAGRTKPQRREGTLGRPL